MTLEELKKRVELIYKFYKENPDKAHRLADDAIIEYINDPEFEKLYYKIRKGF
jgi:hypothetical protein